MRLKIPAAAIAILALVVSCIVGVGDRVPYTASGQGAPYVGQLVQYPSSGQAIISNNGTTPPITLNGQSSCAFNTQSGGAGYTVTPQVSVAPGQWVTLTSIGAKSGDGTYVGALNGTYLSFQLSFTGISGTPISYNYACSASQSTTLTATISGTIPITLPTSCGGGTTGTIPCPAVTSSPGGAVLTENVQANASPYPTTPAGDLRRAVCDKTTAGQCQAVSSGGAALISQAAITGNGATHLVATSVTSNAAGTVNAAATTLYALTVTWNVPNTVTTCWLTLYNATAPTVGTSFVAIYALNTSTPGQLAIIVPPTIGGAFTTAVTYAVTTTPTGSTACNSTANQLWVEAWWI
jgi:hypothetical protein